MSVSGMDILPERIKNEIANRLAPDTEEMRVRVGRPVMLYGNGIISIPVLPTQDECALILERACAHSVYAHEDEIRECFVTLEDGSRVGICGKMCSRGVTLPYGFNIRLAKEAHGAADELMRFMKNGPLSSLIISEPGGGKTTMLRDAARQISAMGYRVSVADERREIAAPVNGIPTLDIGDADVICGCKRAEAISLLIRAMSPEVIITDEIASESDAAAILDALGAGIRVIASAHGGGKDGIMRRRHIRELIECNAFDRLLRIRRDGNKRVLIDITEEKI